MQIGEYLQLVCLYDISHKYTNT